jgi:AraC-like DNA-binding protein
MKTKAFTKRNQRIVNQILQDKKTLTEIGKEHRITKQRVFQIGKTVNIDRTQLIKARRNKALAVLKIAYNEHGTLNDVAEALNISKANLTNIYRKGTGVSFNEATRCRRNSLILQKFVAGQTANAILNDTTKTLDIPNRIPSVNAVYNINTKNNVKRYPNIGDRSKGGSFLPKWILKFIATQYMKLKTTEEIAKMLNDKKIKTTQGVAFTAGNIFSYVNKMRTGRILI